MWADFNLTHLHLRSQLHGFPSPCTSPTRSAAVRAFGVGSVGNVLGVVCRDADANA